MEKLYFTYKKGKTFATPTWKEALERIAFSKFHSSFLYSESWDKADFIMEWGCNYRSKFILCSDDKHFSIKHFDDDDDEVFGVLIKIFHFNTPSPSTTTASSL